MNSRIGLTGLMIAILVVLLFATSPTPIETPKTPLELAGLNLVKDDDSKLEMQDFLGNWSLINFGYTHCPDVCPTNMQMLKQVQSRLASEKIKIFLITVDPSRDTASVLQQYVEFFGENITGVTGTLDSLSEFAIQTGNIFAAQKDQREGAYTVDHSDNIAIVDPRGNRIAILTPPHNAEQITAKLQQLIAY